MVCGSIGQAPLIVCKQRPSLPDDILGELLRIGAGGMADPCAAVLGFVGKVVLATETPVLNDFEHPVSIQGMIASEGDGLSKCSVPIIGLPPHVERRLLP